jgi:hypothetical protein
VGHHEPGCGVPCPHDVCGHCREQAHEWAGERRIAKPAEGLRKVQSSDLLAIDPEVTLSLRALVHCEGEDAVRPRVRTRPSRAPLARDGPRRGLPAARLNSCRGKTLLRAKSASEALVKLCTLPLVAGAKTSDISTPRQEAPPTSRAKPACTNMQGRTPGRRPRSDARGSTSQQRVGPHESPEPRCGRPLSPESVVLTSLPSVEAPTLCSWRGIGGSLRAARQR